MATDHTFLRTANYDVDDETDGLISRSTWSLKLSGVIAGVLLVIGRSASYGAITWAPAYHHASAPLTVIVSTKTPANPLPAIPKTLPSADPAAISKQSAAYEVITFSPARTPAMNRPAMIRTMTQTVVRPAPAIAYQANSVGSAGAGSGSETAGRDPGGQRWLRGRWFGDGDCVNPGGQRRLCRRRFGDRDRVNPGQ